MKKVRFVRVHQLHRVRYEVRFHFPKEFESNTESLVEVVRQIDEMHPWNIDEADQIECLPDSTSYRYADVGEVLERRVIVTPADSPMPWGKVDGYKNHVDKVTENFQEWKDKLVPNTLIIHVDCISG